MIFIVNLCGHGIVDTENAELITEVKGRSNEHELENHP